MKKKKKEKEKVAEEVEETEEVEERRSRCLWTHRLFQLIQPLNASPQPHQTPLTNVVILRVVSWGETLWNGYDKFWIIGAFL